MSQLRLDLSPGDLVRSYGRGLLISGLERHDCVQWFAPECEQNALPPLEGPDDFTRRVLEVVCRHRLHGASDKWTLTFTRPPCGAYHVLGPKTGARTTCCNSSPRLWRRYVFRDCLASFYLLLCSELVAVISRKSAAGSERASDRALPPMISVG